MFYIWCPVESVINISGLTDWTEFALIDRPGQLSCVCVGGHVRWGSRCSSAPKLLLKLPQRFSALAKIIRTSDTQIKAWHGLWLTLDSNAPAFRNNPTICDVLASSHPQAFFSFLVIQILRRLQSEGVKKKKKACNLDSCMKSVFPWPQLPTSFWKHSCLLLEFEDVCVHDYNMKTLNHKGRLSKKGKTQKDCNHLELLYCTRATCNYLQALQKRFYSSTHFAGWETESILWNKGQYRKFL